MGTDIHGGFVKVIRDDKGNVSETEPVSTNWGMNRNYTLFAILAGVRNGFGFAGTYRHEPLIPIAEGRGFPEWFKLGSDVVDEYGDYGEEGSTYFDNDYSPTVEAFMGEHSYTYMTVTEILDWGGWKNHLSQGGVVSVDHYEETIAKGKEPEYCCGGIISGGDVFVIEQEDYWKYKTLTKNPTHVKCFWKSEETLGQMFQWFINEVNRIKQEHGEDVYLCVGFDS